MKMLTVFEAFAALTANSSNASFPVANVTDNDPFVRWKANQYAVDEWIKVDFGAAKSLDSVFLNQCNFPQCKIQGHTSDSWTTPDFELTADLVQDDANNRKGFFKPVAFNYRWLRILIEVGQTLDNAEATPAVGNLIVGTATTGKMYKFEPRLIKETDEYTTPNGAFVQVPKYGRDRHIISMALNDSLAALRAFPRNWSIGVFFADLGYVDEAYLVYPPKEWQPAVRKPLDSDLAAQFPERP